MTSGTNRVNMACPLLGGRILEGLVCNDSVPSSFTFRTRMLCLLAGCPEVEMQHIALSKPSLRE